MSDQQGWVTATGQPEELQVESQCQLVHGLPASHMVEIITLTPYCILIVCETFKKLRDSVNDGSSAYFVSLQFHVPGLYSKGPADRSVSSPIGDPQMWEWYTTKPFLNEVRFIGSVPTPWPSWAIAASTSFLSSAPDAKSTLRTFLSSLETKVREFDSPEKREKDDVDYVMKEFGYPEEDVKAWLSTVGYFHTLEGMDEDMVRSTLRYVPRVRGERHGPSADHLHLLSVRVQHAREGWGRQGAGGRVGRQGRDCRLARLMIMRFIEPRMCSTISDLRSGSGKT